MRLNSNRLSSYASAASDKIPDGNEIAFFRAGENAIVVNENLTIPPWAFCIYIPFGRDAGLIVVGIAPVFFHIHGASSPLAAMRNNCVSLFLQRFCVDPEADL